MTRTMTYLARDMCLLLDIMAHHELLFCSQGSNHLHQQPRTEPHMSLLLGMVLYCGEKFAGKAIFASYVAIL